MWAKTLNGALQLVSSGLPFVFVGAMKQCVLDDPQIQGISLLLNDIPLGQTSIVY